MLATVDERIKIRRNRHSEFMETIKDSARKKNISRVERVLSHRTRGEEEEADRIKSIEDRQSVKTKRLHQRVKEAASEWEDFR